MIKLAGSVIRCLFSRVENSMEERDDTTRLLRLTEVKLNVKEAMEKNNDLSKWELYKETDEFATLKSNFESIFMEEYPEIKTAYLIFVNPLLLKQLN